jgi:hypothetical protein
MQVSFAPEADLRDKILNIVDLSQWAQTDARIDLFCGNLSFILSLNTQNALRRSASA